MNTWTSPRGRDDYAARVAAVSETDIAWFGGWLSADGSIRAADQTGRPAIRFVICDPDPLVRFGELFGNDVVGPVKPSGFGRRPRFVWSVTGWKCALILKRCLPWLSDRYRARAEALIAEDTPWQRGRKLSSAQVEAIRIRLSKGGHGIGRALAAEYGVTDGLISAIRHGRAWIEN